MHRSWIILPLSLGLLMPASLAGGETAAPAGSVADLCPMIDARDTIDSARSTVAARLGSPIKEEALETQYILTYRRKDGSQFFVVLSRNDGQLEATCYASNR